MMAGRYGAYPKYKESGVTWAGKIPKHWNPLRFKYALAEKKKTSNSTLDAGSISFGNVVYKNSDNLAAETKESYQEVLAGEFLINPLNLNFDLISLRTALSKIDVVVSTGYIVLISSDRLVKNYVRWLLHEFDVAHMKTLGAGVRQTINYSDIGNSYFFEPSQDEQTRIANFLDHETAKIDTLIEKQQQLIKLLQEKRQAVISHAVTKGLNPNAPMRDSGVEWLGEVPEHWALKPLKYVVNIRSGGTPNKENSDYWGGDIPWASAKDLKQDCLHDTIDHITEFAISSGAASLVPVGTILVVVRGMILARMFPVSVASVRMAINQDLKAIVPVGSFSGEFLFWLLKGTAEESLNRLDEAGHGTKALRMDAWTSMKLPIPPLTEQGEISGYLEKMTGRFDLLSARAQQKINLLQERRTVLISAAVTGKIDVRDWQPPVDSRLRGNDEVAA
jgi:type I restriction enzyme, S subunit